MSGMEPMGEIDPRYSAPGATPTPWSEGRERLERAMVYQLSTVRRDGRPHVTPVAGIWLDDAFHFTTGVAEQKARNVQHDPACAVTVGTDAFEGLDVVLEGACVRVTDGPTLQRLAEAYVAKYGDIFRFDVRGDMLTSDDGGDALAYRIRASKALGFAKGDPFSQTRWRFAAGR